MCFANSLLTKEGRILKNFRRLPPVESDDNSGFLPDKQDGIMHRFALEREIILYHRPKQRLLENRNQRTRSWQKHLTKCILQIHQNDFRTVERSKEVPKCNGCDTSLSEMEILFRVLWRCRSFLQQWGGPHFPCEIRSDAFLPPRCIVEVEEMLLLRQKNRLTRSRHQSRFFIIRTTSNRSYSEVENTNDGNRIKTILGSFKRLSMIRFELRTNINVTEREVEERPTEEVLKFEKRRGYGSQDATGKTFYASNICIIEEERKPSCRNRIIWSKSWMGIAAGKARSQNEQSDISPARSWKQKKITTRPNKNVWHPYGPF